jgi:hypothetical protein
MFLCTYLDRKAVHASDPPKRLSRRTRRETLKRTREPAVPSVAVVSSQTLITYRSCRQSVEPDNDNGSLRAKRANGEDSLRMTVSAYGIQQDWHPLPRNQRHLIQSS